ncbi:S49 family peptidase [Flammeovirga aprica]|uniref:Peptidase S49 domain-containing protein n=1 Tax=Flammeovirga aprica JL-4 TaxID=694437 RepID=A0A7X9P0A7_9BACT|nr:S49 family peptidase [Flammeovirga aprica]NME67194.1 hypothetical protein [Flammeovirga aprica JL-4]
MKSGFFIYNEILQGRWLLTADAARAYSHLVASVLNGDFSESEEKQAENCLQVINAEGNTYRTYGFTHVEEECHVSIDLSGPLTYQDGYCNYGMKSYAKWIQEADKKPNIKGIILNLSTPGGQALGTEYLVNVISNISTPKVAFVEQMACSGGYWIASACDQIILSSATALVGSIGTMVSYTDFTEYYAKLGIKTVMYRATKSKDKNLPAEEMLGGKPDKYIETQLDPLNNGFHASVKSNRPQIDDSCLTGATYFASDAIELGLADKIGLYDDAISALSDIQNNINSAEEMEFLNKVKAGLGLDAEPQAIADAIETQATELEQSVQDATARAETAEARVTELESELATANARIQELEDEPATTPAVAQVQGDQFAGASQDEDYIEDETAQMAKKQGLKVDYSFKYTPQNNNVLI